MSKRRYWNPSDSRDSTYLGESTGYAVAFFDLDSEFLGIQRMTTPNWRGHAQECDLQIEGRYRKFKLMGVRMDLGLALMVYVEVDPSDD